MSKNFIRIKDGINLASLTSDPTDSVTGDMYYNSATKVLRLYNGTIWEDVAIDQGAIEAIDVLYDNSASGLVATEVQSAIDEIQDNLLDTYGESIYVSSTSGNDTTGTGSVIYPYASINKAISTAIYPSKKYVIRLAPGDYSGAQVDWLPNVDLVGSGTSSNVQQTISYVASAGSDTGFIFSQVNCSDIFLNFDTAASAIPTFSDGVYSVTRQDSQGTGPWALRINDSTIGDFDVTGNNLLSNCLFVSTAQVQPGAQLYCSDCVIGIQLDLIDTAVIGLSGCTVPGILNGITNTDIPTVRTDANSIIGTTLTNVNLSLTEDSKYISYDPSVSGLTATTVKAAIDEVIAQKGSANGIAPLGADTKIPSAYIPSLAISETFVVADQAARLALTAQVGDIAVETDNSTTYILQQEPASVDGNWVQLLTPPSAVTSVNSQTGNVSLDTDDINEGSTNLYFTDSRAVAAINAVGYVKADGTVPLTGDLNANTHKITNVVDPTNPQDATTKNYVDTAIIGAAGANQTLSNLTSPVAVNQDLLPQGYNAHNIGSNSNLWNTVRAHFYSGNGDNIVVTGDITNSTNPLTISNVSDTSKLYPGMALYSPDVISYSEISSISGTTITASGFAPGLVSSTFTIVPQVSIKSDDVVSGTLLSGATVARSGAVLSGRSGRVQLSTGDTYASGKTGDLSIYSGNAISGSSQATGAVSMLSGRNVGSAGSGNIQVRSGDTGVATSGSITIGSGNSSSGNSGSVEIVSGNAFSGTRGVVGLNGSYVDVHNTNIRNLLDPVNPQDASTKAYVDAKPAPLPPITYNYLSSYNGNPGNGDFEKGNTTGFETFSVTLTNKIPTSAPVLGGPTSFTSFFADNTDPLAESYSLVTGNNSSGLSAGDGIITSTFTIDRQDLAKVLNIQFSYELTNGIVVSNFSGTSDNTWAVYIYDVTNAEWIQPAGVYNIVQSSGVGKCTATFQTDSASTQYKLAIIGINSTSGGSISMKWDDFSVSPANYQYGTPVTDAQQYIPAFTNNLGSITIASLTYQIVGDLYFIKGRINVSSPGAGGPQIALPNGAVIDSVKLASTSKVGTANSQSNQTQFNVNAQPGTNYIMFSSNLSAGSGSGLLQTSDILSFECSVPIAGLSSNVQMSNDTDTRVISFSGTMPSQAVTGTVTDISVTPRNDNTGSWNGTQFIVPVAGDYAVSVSQGHSSANATPAVYLNNTLYSFMSTAPTATQQAAGAALLTGLKAGDIISTRNTVTGTVQVGNLGIWRLSGPSVIAASETVAASYYSSSGQVLSAGAIVDYEGKYVDTHNSVTTGAGVWKFTAPVSGIYDINASIYNNTGAQLGLNIEKNGSSISVNYTSPSGNATASPQILINLVAGDIITVRIAGPGLTMTTNAFQNLVSIKRIGL